MTAVALSPPAPLPLPRRSAAHRLALALVWLTVVAGSVVASEPAPVDVLTMGLVLLLPLIGLVAVSRALVGLLALMLVVAAGGYLAAGMAVEIGQAVTHTSVSLYLYVAAFVLAAFVAKRPEAHARLMLNAYLWAASVAALAGIAGYFDLFPGAHALLTRYDRATGLFKDPNVFGPFLVPALVYAASRFAALPLRKALAPLVVLLLVGLAMLLSFSRGAWFNLVVALAVYGMLYLLTLRSHRARLRFAGLAVAGLVALAALVAAALQFDAVATLYEERAALTHSYDVGPEGRFGGQMKAAGLALEHPLGIGAQQFVPHYHHEEPHNVYAAMFLNAGWLGGLVFIALVVSTAWWGLRHAFVRCATQPLFLVVYASFLGHVLEGFIIDLDHWRHFYLLLALAWGLMLGERGAHAGSDPSPPRLRSTVASRRGV
jgi:O-antigen ligase